MSKIKRITVSNLKAIAETSANFNGCTAIVTAGNNKGKTTLLKGIFERIRGIKPEKILRIGESEGFAECELTTGEKFKWEFKTVKDALREKLTYISQKDIKSSVTREIAQTFFPQIFDVDAFLSAQPATQRKMLQKLVGLDFTDVDNRYKESYDERESKNRRSLEAKIKFDAAVMPENVAAVDIVQLLSDKDAIRTKLNWEYLDNKKYNETLRTNYNDERYRVQENWYRRQEQENNKAKAIENAEVSLDKLITLGYTGSEVRNWINTLPRKQEIDIEVEVSKIKQPVYIKEMPDDTPLKEIEAKINEAGETNRKAQLYKDWDDLRTAMHNANKESGEADKKVKAIEKERMDMIRGANMPEGFSFSDDGILYQNLPFTRQQLSSSGIYIAALKLANMTLGEVKTLHFDASFLDKNSLNEIEAWANENDLQLLIERPDFEGGEIEYQIINK